MSCKISLLLLLVTTLLVFKVGYTVGSSEPFDVVFIVDEAKRMERVHDNIRSNVNFIFDEFNRLGAPGSRVGLVGFGNGPPIQGHNFLEDTAHIHSVLTNDRNVFSAGANALKSDGRNKPTFKAVPSVTETIAAGGLDIGLQRNRPFCVALFTDEDTDGGYQQRTIDYLLNNLPNQANATGTFFPVLPNGKDLFDPYMPIVQATGGGIADLNTFRSGSQNQQVITFILNTCNIAVNRIVITPLTATYTLGSTIAATDHIMTIKTNQKNQRVTLTVLDGPDMGMTYQLVTDGSTGTISQLYNPQIRNPSYLGGTIHFQACLTGNNFCAYSSAEFQHPVCANVDCSSLDTDCVIGICDPTNGQCIQQNKVDGTLCTDGLICTFDTCQNGNCVGDPDDLEVANIEYTQGTIQANFTANNEAESHVEMEFKYLGTGSGVHLTTYEAIVYDDSLCEGKIIGITDGAKKMDEDFTTIVEPPLLFLDIEGTAVFPKLLVRPNFNNMEITNFFEFFTECENDIQDNGIPDNIDIFQQFCGELEFCIEFQTLVCDEQKSSVNVNVLANLAVDVAECDNGECKINVAFKRDAPVIESFDDISIDFQIGSYPCDEFGTPIAATFTQGDPVTACLQIEGNTAGVCFLDVVDMDLNVQNSNSGVSGYGIIPQGPPPDNLFWGDANNPAPVGSDGRALVVKFFPPAEEILNVASGDTVMAQFDLAVNMGLGCYCDGTCDNSRRSLLQTDQSYVLKSPGQAFEVEFKVVPNNKTISECDGLFDTGLPWFGDFCPFQALFAWIESLFSFL